MAQSKVVAGVVVARVETERLLVLLNGIAQQLLLAFAVGKGHFLTNVAAVVEGHRLDLRILLEARGFEIETVGRAGIALGQIRVAKVEEGAGTVRVVVQGLAIERGRSIVIVGTESRIAAVHELPLGRLRRGCACGHSQEAPHLYYI